MADNNTKIILIAEDRTSGAFASVTRGLQGMETSALVASRALGAIGVTFSAAAAVAFVKGTIDAADGMNDLSQKVGIGVKQLAGWTLAANQSGTSMETVAKGVKSLSTYMVEHGDRLKAAGITATDAHGAMTQLADLFKEMPDGIEKTALVTQVFGKAGMDLLPMFNLGSQGLAEMQKKAEAYGKKMAELAPMADEFNDQLAEMALHSKAAGVNITSYFMPGLVGLSRWLNDIASGGKKAWNAVAWVVGGLPEGVTLGDEPAPAAGAAAAAGSASSRAKKLGGRGPSTAGGTSTRSAALTPLQRALAEQERRLAAMNSGFDEQTVSVESVTRKYEKALEDRAAAMDAAHEARMEQQRIETEGEGAIQEWINKNNAALKDQTDIAKDLGMTFASAAENAILKWESVGDVLNGLANDVARIFLRKTFTEPMAGAIGKFVDGLDLSNIFGGARAGGGPVAGGTAYLVGERGPELFVPGASGGIIPNGALGGGGTNVIINNYSSAKTTQTTRTGADGKRELVVMIEDVVNGLIGGGGLDASMRQNFGARRVGVLRG